MALQTQNTGGALQQSTLSTIQFLANMTFPTQGNVWFVCPRTGSDQNNSGQSPQSPFKTLRFALSMATANQNDIVYLMAQGNTASLTTDYQTSNLDWNKNAVHLIGVNAGPFVGQRSRVSVDANTASFANLFTVSANGCMIKNIQFFQGVGSTNPSAASTCVTVSGDRNVFINCNIMGVGHANLDDTGSNDLTVSGSENLFQHCYIGLDTIIRASALAGVVMSGSNTRNCFEDCQFEAYTSSTSYKLVSVATGTDRWLKFKNCEFNAVQNITSSALPSGAIGITTMNGSVIIMNCGFFGITQITTADNAYVLALAFNGVATGHLIGIAQAVDAA
jgi:hypothetical protein